MPSKYNEVASLQGTFELVRGEIERTWEAYYSYASGLRTWFVAYGIGAIALFVTNPDPFKSMSSGWRATCAALLLGGAFLQIVLTWMNKVGNYSWFKYWDEFFGQLAQAGGDLTKIKEPRAEYASLRGQSFVWDIVFDVLSGLCFLAGTALMVVQLVNPNILQVS
jgi:hypothetical protein